MCTSPRRVFGVAHNVAVHAGVLRSANWRYKSEGKHGWATIFGRILVGYLDTHPLEVDLITPNPGYGERLHNEAVITAAAKEDFLWPWDQDPWAMSKREATERSKSKGLIEKREAARAHVEAISVDDDRIRDKRVLVYDDVFTTGSQLNAVAQLLIDHGAHSVDGLVLARAPWGGAP